MKNSNHFLSLIWIIGCTLMGNAQEVYFPDKGVEWRHLPDAESKINSQTLDKAVQFAMDNEYSGSRDLRIAILEGFKREPYHSLLGPVKKRGGPAGVILKEGFIVREWGATDRVDMTFSVTKSFLSTVAGLAYDEGLLRSTSDMVADYIWDGTFEGEHNSKISWEHLLQQNSDWSGKLWGLEDWADRPPLDGGIDEWKNRELLEPGTVMEYNDVRVNVLAYALTHIWRSPVPMVLNERIMKPIGASSAWRWFGYDHAWTVIDGLKVQSVTGGGHSGGGMFISTLDMARFGLLFLNNGKWKEQQLLSADWIAKATNASVPNPNYGYMWWLNRKGDRYWKGLPENIFYAAGFGGNFIVIIPDKQVVVVTRWLEPSKIGEFVRMVYSAVE